MRSREKLRAAWFAFAYYFSWVLFGLGGFLLNLVCIPLLLAPNRERLGPVVRRGIRWLFGFWLKWMHASRVLRVDWRGFDRPLPAGVVYVANHPTLVDAPFLLARLPDAVCIFKPSLLRNPLVAPAALMAGYVSGDGGVDLIRKVADRVAAGRSLLIFPEGTRTSPGAPLNPLRPGFDLIARRARAPVRIIRVRSTPLIARKGNPWWRVPPLPARFEFTLDELIPADRLDSAETLTARLAAHFDSANTLDPDNADA